MTSRPASPARVLGAVFLVLALAGCAGGPVRDTPVSSERGSSALPASAAPTESRAPTPGKGSADPDDINGDGHRDLLVPVLLGERGPTDVPEQRLGVIFGSADGLDPTTRVVYGRQDLGLPELSPERDTLERTPSEGMVTADLDGDGFPDLVTTVAGDARVTDGQVSGQPMIPHVTWGGPEGWDGRRAATALRLPDSASKLGVESLVRGDFDGDGHHDLAALAVNQSSFVVLYGPFSRSGAPARTDTDIPWMDGTLHADAIDPSGTPRATALLLEHISDGEQAGNTLHPAHRGGGLSADGRELRRGGAHAFGDFDGDGKRDVAIGDSGSRNDEPGYETEPPEVDGSLTVYPGDGGDPVTHQLPKVPEGAATMYGPGGFVAADPDGDGRDGILVATYEGATLIDGDQRIPVLRQGPEVVDGKKIPAANRRARPAGAADFDGDGRDELILHWSADELFALYGERPTHWWITEGTSDRDQTSFTTEFGSSPS